MKKNIYLTSLYGIKNIGGLERVNKYIYDILSEKYNVKILEKREKIYKHGDWLLQSLRISLKLYFIRNKFVIGTSWHSFFYPCDLTFHHGTQMGTIINLHNSTKYTRRIANMEKISAILSKKNIAVGKNVKKELIEYYKISKNKIFILNNFVDDSLFIPKKIQRNTNKIIILFAGSLCKRKGIDYLIQLSNFIESSNKYLLYIATNSKSNSEYFVNKKNTLIFFSLTEKEMVDFYNSGDILFFPSLYEGFSMATLEALSCGIPVIGTKWAIMEELLTFDFVKITNIKNMEKVISDVNYLIKNFNNKKNLIHNLISTSFGKEQYKTKLLNLIEEK